MDDIILLLQVDRPLGLAAAGAEGTAGNLRLGAAPTFAFQT